MRGWSGTWQRVDEWRESIAVRKVEVFGTSILLAFAFIIRPNQAFTRDESSWPWEGRTCSTRTTPVNL
jgi:hypothetical protein